MAGLAVIVLGPEILMYTATTTRCVSGHITNIGPAIFINEIGTRKACLAVIVLGPKILIYTGLAFGFIESFGPL